MTNMANKRNWRPSHEEMEMVRTIMKRAKEYNLENEVMAYAIAAAKRIPKATWTEILWYALEEWDV